MSELETRGLEVKKAEEDLDHIRLYLKRGDYMRSPVPFERIGIF